MEQTATITIFREDACDLLEPAIRYALPRMTGIYSDAQSWLSSLWPALKTGERTNLLDQIEAKLREQDAPAMWERVDKPGWQQIVVAFAPRLDEPVVAQAEIPLEAAYTLIGALLRTALSHSGYDEQGEPWHADRPGSYRALELTGRYGVQLHHAHQLAQYVREITDAWGFHPPYSYDLREQWVALGRSLYRRAAEIADSDPDEARFFARRDNVDAYLTLERVV